MLLVQRLLAALGIHGARLEIQVTEEVHPRGSDIHGRVILHGGVVRQRISSLFVCLVEPDQGSGTGRDAVRQTIHLASDLVPEPGSRREFAFTCPIPDDAAISFWVADNPMLAFRSGLRAEADVPGTVSARATRRLTIVPHREIAAVLQAFRRIGFRDAPMLRPRLLAMAVHGRYDHAFRPPDALRDQISGVNIVFWVGNGLISGEIALYRTEASVHNLLKAIVGANRQDFRISVPRADVMNQDGSARPEGAVPHIEAILVEALAMPGDLSKRLLHPAAAPDDSGLLLRPAGRPEPADSASLLRASEPDPNE